MLPLPRPEETARREAESLAEHREFMLEAPLTRVLSDSPFVDRDSLLAGLDAFHRERMAKIPSFTKYPEAKPWVEHQLAVDREVQRLAGLTDREMALRRSLHHYLTFRGFIHAKPAAQTAEKCRIAYLPESDRGQVHVKNVDDPCTYWKALEPAPMQMPWRDTGFAQDGVGSGLHIDDEPDELFPLDPRVMVHHYAGDVPGAIDFFTRYRGFWGGGNLVIRDRQKRSAAIEKCSYNFIEVFHPGPDGRSHCSGMACRDPQSPQGRYQREKRRQYLTLFGQPSHGPDQVFWDACDRAERMLGETVAKLGPKPRLDDLLPRFLTPWPEGLSKNGAKFHPDQDVPEYTLITWAALLDEKRLMRWQRDPGTLEMAAEPEVYQF